MDPNDRKPSVIEDLTSEVGKHGSKPDGKPDAQKGRDSQSAKGSIQVNGRERGSGKQSPSPIHPASESRTQLAPGDVSWDGASQPATKAIVLEPKQKTARSEPRRMLSGASLTGSMLAERYQVEERIGEGGMGIVYKATHVGLQKPVAVKVLMPELNSISGIVERFEREARSLSRLDHPGIVRVMDFGKSGKGLLYLVMDYVDGIPLSSLIRREGPFSAERAVALTRQILLALSHAHNLGVVHRDLKPDNIMVLDAGSVTEHIRILDFGIAKIVEESDSPNSEPLTKAGMVFGTPEYLSPEQAAGEAESVDATSDLYTVGIILYEMLTKRRPFESTNRMALLNQHMTKKPCLVSEVEGAATIPTELDQIIMRALEKKREDRFASAMQFYAALSAVPVEQRPMTFWPGAVPPMNTLPPVQVIHKSRLRLWHYILMAAILGAGAAGTYFILRHTTRPVPQKRLTDLEDEKDLLKGLDKSLIPDVRAARGHLVALRPKKAIRILKPLTEKYPNQPVLFYLIGRAYLMTGTRANDIRALDAFTKAMQLAPSYRKHKRIHEQIASLLRSKYRSVRKATITFVDEQLGADAADIIERTSKQHPDYEVIRELLVVAEKHGIGKTVDKYRLYQLMLRDSPLCIERREAARQLMLLADPSALPFLKKALHRKPWRYGGRKKSNTCIKPTLEQAIQTLKAHKKAAQDHPEDMQQ
ncbi:MAG: protein kinase [Deltaproteobacteria bacterium]|nr:protein kinase [Deltaproteobacteria bacterium]